ncbi:unnamed protein product [Ceratitis capitata]|uniref:(Mediterranean fruit fly) hypothetical protein n=1 Tax=Ceratitis capitata TaxID=7213 RepID=A0A811TZ20_CERCA|nr:unnamed protein product [Ceratitis capitata]
MVACRANKKTKPVATLNTILYPKSSYPPLNTAESVENPAKDYKQQMLWLHQQQPNGEDIHEKQLENAENTSSSSGNYDT